MDLDDSFTDALLQRNKARKQYKVIKEGETPELNSKKRYALVEERQIRNQDGDSPKRSVEKETDDSPKRQCLEKYENSQTNQWPIQKSKNSDYEKENAPMIDSPVGSFVPFKSSHDVRGLAALKKTSCYESSASSLSDFKPEIEENSCSTYVFSTNSSDMCSGRKTRLANLAANINQWEDDTQTHTFSNNITSLSTTFLKQTSNFSSTNKVSFAKQPDIIRSENVSTSPLHNADVLSPSKKSSIKSSPGKSSHKLDVWGQAIQATLEDDSSPKKPTIFVQAVDNKREYVKKENLSENAKPAINFHNKLKMFGNAKAAEDLNKSFEPSELPLSARKALFERGLHGEGNKIKHQSFEPKLSVAQRAAMFENASQNSATISKPVSNFRPKNINPPSKISPAKPPKLANIDIHSSPLKPLSAERPASLEKVKVSTPSSGSPIKKINTDTRAVEQMLLARVNSNSELKDQNVINEEKTAKNPMVNYWEKLSASSKSCNSNSEEEFTVPKALKDESEEDYESEIESKYEQENDSDLNEEKETESEFNYEQETESEVNYEQETESEVNYDRETESELNYERETESELNYNTEMTEEDYSESDAESESAMEEDNVFKSPKGIPLASKNAVLTIKKSPVKPLTNRNLSSWRENIYVEDSCDATSFSDESSYPESLVSNDIRSGAEYHQNYASSSSSLASSCDTTESLKESEDNFTKTSSHGSNISDSPLTYTVSFYRKQKQGPRTPPPQIQQTIVRREQMATTPSSSRQPSVIQEQIKMYQEEILKQQTIIGQTSQALNLCHATAEFSGSQEQVEGERLLLIATQKRQALLNEIQRLKAHGAEGGDVPDGTGTLTISDLKLPLKQEFLAAKLEGKINDAVHWFLCLIRYGAQVIVTQMVSTDDRVSNGTLCFTNHIKLQNLPPDFSIVFEVYALQTKKEKLPHEKKYHIKKDKGTMRLTPKGRKSDNKLLVPTISSPGGPHAVRSPSFGVIGFTRFTVHNCNKKIFTLDKVPFASPLEGILEVQLHLHAEHKVLEKGFLTMFEDVSGFGAWHRRWCVLSAEHLTYWKYPDDEDRKPPIGSLDLEQCITAKVKPVSRDECARPHTFKLKIVRPQAKGDRKTLITECSNTQTTFKHLLSADTKEERIYWCNKLNEVLATLRKWNPRARQPADSDTE